MSNKVKVDDNELWTSNTKGMDDSTPLTQRAVIRDGSGHVAACDMAKLERQTNIMRKALESMRAEIKLRTFGLYCNHPDMAEEALKEVEELRK